MVFIRRNEINRRQYAKAARAGLIAAILGVLIPMGGSAQPISPGHNQNGQSKVTRNTPIAPIGSPQYKPSCDEPTSVEDANYCVQKRAAVAAEEQAEWGKDQLVASWIGIFAVVATLAYTVQAVKASQRSAKAAEDAVAFSNALLSHSQEATRRELRAYLGVNSRSELSEEGGLTFEGMLTIPTKIEALMFVVNYGKTPAYNVRVQSGIAVQEFPQENELPPLGAAEDRSRSVLNPGQTFGINHGHVYIPGPTHRHGLASGNLAVYVYGRLDFVDVFGNPQWVTYRGFNLKAGAKNAGIELSAEGNDAS